MAPRDIRRLNTPPAQIGLTNRHRGKIVPRTEGDGRKLNVTTPGSHGIAPHGITSLDKVDPKFNSQNP
jgi:hypothetical protein